MRKVKAAQYVASHPGEVCPAKWKEGEGDFRLRPSIWSAKSDRSWLRWHRVVKSRFRMLT